MLGLEHFKLTKEDRLSLDTEWSSIVTLSEETETLLIQKLRGRLSPDDTTHLQFGLAYSHRERHTSAEILRDDSDLYAKFAKAIEITARNAGEMKEFDLRDRCEFMHRNITNTMKTIAKILKENDLKPPKKPEYPGLEKELNELTQKFLKIFFPPEEDTTDHPSKELLYIVRDIAIVREMLEMVSKFKQDIGSITD